MSFNVFGVPISPNLSDYLSVAALVFSGYTFLVGSRRWSRSKKSEEIKTARELMDRVIAKTERLKEPPFRISDGLSPDSNYYDSQKVLDKMTDVLEEIDYYGLLVKNDLIKEFELLQHDRIEINDIWHQLSGSGKEICDLLEEKVSALDGGINQ
jgi:hypothetical protein